MTWPVLADELDALARRLQRMSLVRSEQAYETRSEIVHEIRQTARRVREAARKAPPLSRGRGEANPAKPTARERAEGIMQRYPKTVARLGATITDQNGNIIPISFKRRRGTGRVVPKGYR